MAGDEAFAAIPDLLDFEPVPRRAHHNGWTPEHQRAFIAALAITGSPRQAARHVGRAQYGAEALRTAKGGRSFAAAWDAAMELARDCELGRLHDNLGELARKTEEAHARAKEAGRLVPPDEHDDVDGGEDRERKEAIERMSAKVRRLRQDMIRDEIMPYPEKRAAWITLYGLEEIEAIESTERSDAGASAAGAARRDAWSDRPTGREASPIDVTDSLRDGAASTSSPTPPEKPAPSSSKRSGPRVRRV
jgi:hypothetical protein